MAIHLSQDESLDPFSGLPRALKPFADAVGKPPPTYNAAHRAFLDAKFDAVRIGGRLYVRRADYPAIARVLGLLPPDEADVASVPVAA